MKDEIMNKAENRIYMLDMLKGITIYFVVWGHVIQRCYAGDVFYENLVFRFIYSFHMPLFISGYLFFISCQKGDLVT